MPSSSSKPRCTVTVNGQRMGTPLSVEVTNARHFSADTFHATWPIGNLPAGLGIAYWASTATAEVEVFAGFEGPDGTTPWNSLIFGMVDSVDLDLVGGTLRLSGRDLSSRLMDSRTSEKYRNLTSSQIVQIIAKNHGLSASVTETTTPAGSFYEIDHAQMNLEQTEWDLLKYLAEHEGFDLWVSGRTICFQPPVPESAAPYYLAWSAPNSGPPNASFIDLKMKRALTLAKDVEVTVRSWHQADGKAFTKTFRVSQQGGKPSAPPQIYVRNFPNLNPDEAERKAKSLAEEITRYERVITAELPGDFSLSARSLVRLTGTGTEFDQTYYPDTVSRSLSMSGGFRMSLSAKNHSPQSEVSI